MSEELQRPRRLLKKMDTDLLTNTGFSTTGIAITAVGFVVCILTVLALAIHNSRLGKQKKPELKFETEENQKQYKYVL